ncbi:PREDICTED: uncharacterized protein LOC106297617 [Brassica oleracea var. oleracea]|uniref:uncharacterized protein LOC106297617 n=1 Tax=Brassica oleracea var. oleracea TaxID=109376 RepID=UPI0006A6DFDE|nr:PREDICTED: uncharacterized protein LOC106297617 [Brassica oleracea var. oleracea]
MVDETFLKRKYKGVLLVATALDGNSSLYPIAFGVVDSENDLAWNWFMRQLNVVIADDHSLAFVSAGIPQLLKLLQDGKGIAGLVAKAFKAYRAADFRKVVTSIFAITPQIGKYLIDAEVRKLACCQFPGYIYDIRTTNPAESINSALRTPREFPVILLLDSIREMMTRWFFKRRTLSSKHSKPLTIAVEKKFDRRIEKGKTFKVFPVSDHRFLVQGDTFDSSIDLVHHKSRLQCLKPHTLPDDMYTTASWRSTYEESINPISVPEDAWKVPSHVEKS